MEVICVLSQLHEIDQKLEKSSESQLSKNCHAAFSLALLEELKNTRVSMEKFFVMVSS
jgi:hypothetical protein